ncbi:hypothetical protein BDD12DRAFT_874962 [Trichophaea hybrida]|nr:hypothetical protein BDD12DRAFT_874962 [Trichophaea hybrida]
MTDQFHWNLEGLDEARFLALANLLSLRNGGQLELPTVYDGAADADTDADIEHISVCDTNIVDELAEESCIPEQLKMQFLDRLAEVMSTKKGGTHVACATMTETDDTTTIFVARNGSFGVEDTECFRTFERCLSAKLGSTTGCDKMDDDLWNALLVHYDVRLKETYIPNLKKCFDHCANLFQTDVSPTSDLDCLYDLRSLCLRRSHALRPAEQRRRLVLGAHAVRESITSRDHLLGTLVPDHTKLWKAICYLARLRTAYCTFLKARAELATFSTISIVPISPPKAKKIPTPLTFSKTLQLVGLTPTNNTVRRYIHRNSIVSKAEKEFATAQQRGPHVHAELQMVLYLMQIDRLKEVHYIGCSKRSCYLCWQFLQVLPSKISTRGCHGKLYSRWTVPKISKLPSGSGTAISDALQTVQNRMEVLLKSPIAGNYNHVPESSIGSRIAANAAPDQFSGIISGVVEEYKRQNDLVQRHGYLREVLKNDVDAETDFIPERTPDTLLQPILEQKCDICGELTSRRCSLCGTDWFCSEFCESQQSHRHKFKCRGRQITTADYLFIDMQNDLLPDAEDVCHDFGFTSLDSFVDKTKLFGLYQGLVIHSVSSEQLHKWQSEKSLEANIIAVYTAVPENCRGSYFPWFMKNKHKIQFGEPEPDFEEWFREARSLLEPSDRNKDINSLQPNAKRECLHFYSVILHHSHPRPEQDMFFDFGFCTCAGERDEAMLGVLYELLMVGERFLPKSYQHTFPKRKFCTFKEFWKAYEAGTMVSLMDAYGLRRERSHFPQLELFMGRQRGCHEWSVWYLNQFLMSESVKVPPTAVWMDYGFRNCKFPDEEMMLKEIYKKLLWEKRVDMVELHRAASAERIFDFAGKHIVPLDSRFKRLMMSV